MTTIIGKYIVNDDNESFKIRYRHTFSDLSGSFIFFLSLALGLLLFYVSSKTFKPDTLTSWMLLVAGIALFLFGLYSVIAGFYNPRNGILQIAKLKNEVIIRDLFKTNVFKIDSVNSVTYDIAGVYKPRMKYSMLSIRLSDGKKLKCFIIRSTLPVDTGREVEKDLHSTSRQLRDLISKEIQRIKTTANTG